MQNDNVLTIPRDLLQDLIDDVSDYAASREFKPREKVWRDDVLARARDLLATPLPEPRAPKCDGSGAVSVSVDDWSECPVCRGAGCQPKPHKWDEDGERCERCGDKDWMPDSVCRGRKPEPRAEVTNTAEAAFEAFAARYDQESNEWLDMDAQQTFIHGWNAARTGASS
ncbi:hypothetical protein [Burkholderia vietnamiensis]|uniref:hypothetical protein n=1 Tax=Burkholderia vietnamiensis TaxID=60552 RepID=UPI00158A9A49|nr:hypothetical protein [Burkholderia vietnamiensis]